MLGRMNIMTNITQISRLFRGMAYSTLVLFCDLALAQPGAYQPRNIAIIIPLSGPRAAIGAAVRNSIKLAEEKAGPAAELVKLRYEDDQYDAAKATSALRALMVRMTVDCVVTFGSPAGNALAPIVEQAQIPMFNIGREPDPAMGRRFVVRTVNPSVDYVRTLQTYLRSQGLKKFTVVSSEVSFLRSVIKAWESEMLAEESLDIIQDFGPRDFDFRSALLRLRGTPGGWVGLFLLPEQIAAFARQVHEQRLSLKIYGTDLLKEGAKLSADSRWLQGAVYSINQVPTEFIERYSARFGSEGAEWLAFAASAYDVLNLLYDTYSRYSPRTPADTLAAFEIVAAQSMTPRLILSPTYGKYLEYPIELKVIQ